MQATHTMYTQLWALIKLVSKDLDNGYAGASLKYLALSKKEPF